MLKLKLMLDFSPESDAFGQPKSGNKNPSQKK